jgi:hypothetical protein
MPAHCAFTVRRIGTETFAKHAYKAQEAGELTFSKGDRITVLRKDDSGWWEGKCKGKTGVFPSNYVA